jgi:hypothetical protein
MERKVIGKKKGERREREERGREERREKGEKRKRGGREEEERGIQSNSNRVNIKRRIKSKYYIKYCPANETHCAYDRYI